MNYRIRNCAFDDLDFILELKELGIKWYVEKIYGWDYEIQKQLTFNELNNNISNIKIIVIDEIDAGVTTFNEYDNYFEIGLTIIHPRYQNKGIASQILKKYIDIAKSKRKRIIIKTYKENPAQRLYLKLGFIEYKRDNTHIYYEINN